MKERALLGRRQIRQIIIHSNFILWIIHRDGESWKWTLEIQPCRKQSPVLLTYLPGHNYICLCVCVSVRSYRVSWLLEKARLTAVHCIIFHQRVSAHMHTHTYLKLIARKGKGKVQCSPPTQTPIRTHTLQTGSWPLLGLVFFKDAAPFFMRVCACCCAHLTVCKAESPRPTGADHQRKQLWLVDNTRLFSQFKLWLLMRFWCLVRDYFALSDWIK